MSDDTGENSEIARTREITNKKKADRDLLLKKYRQNEDKLRTDQPSGQMDAISTEGPEKILKSKAENPNTTGELGDLLKRLNEKKEADKQMSTSPQETIEKADNEQVSSGRSIEETKVEEINIYKPKKAEEKATKNREIAIEGEEQETSKIGGSDKKTEIIGPSGELGSLLKRLNEKKEADKQMSTSPQEKIEKADNEQMSGGISVKETKVEKIAISKPEKAEEKLTGEEKGSTTEDEKELPLEESVETEGTANDLVKNILEEASTTDISQYIEQDDEEEEIEIEKKDLTEQNKEDIGFIDKVKNLFKQEEVEIEPYNLELHGPLCIFR
ncbi:MAG: hypothetical protein KAJ10_11345, partial [Thermodesulfovibrionia bacterium]|nr:hypothetical protein [Thermodesulfovibrionia bacterium]